MGPTPPVALPPVTANYSNTFQQAQSQAPPAQSAYQFSRATDGKTRVDSGNTSVISNPATAQTIVLDHVKKTATIQPAPAPAPPSAGMPQMPQFSAPALPGQPQAPQAPQVQNLGKSVMQGHEVQGTLTVTPPMAPPKPPAFQAPGAPAAPQAPGMPGAPAAPQMPGMPKVPGAPQMPGMPKAPAAPQIPGMAAAPAAPQIPGMPKPPAAPQIPGMPKAPAAPATPGAPAAPQTPTTTEVWTSTKMGVPMMMKMSGGFGQLTQVCHSAVPGEPHPSAFQIPPGYKVVGG